MPSPAVALARCFLLVVAALPLLTTATHFRGGLLSCYPVITSNSSGGVDRSGNIQIECAFRIGWRKNFSNGTECNSTSIMTQTLVKGPSTSSSRRFKLRCYEGCTRGYIVDDLMFYCTDFNEDENWTQGSRVFPYTLSNSTRRLVLQMRDCCWISLVSGDNRSIRWGMAMNLSVRADTGRVNSCPTSAQLPILRLQHGCEHTLSIHTEDADGDLVRCRWAEKKNAQGLDECGGVCNTLPNANLTKEPCELRVPGNLAVGYHAVALTLEDFPQSSPGAFPFSQVPLQFLLDIFNSSSPCSFRPEFVPPTPEHNMCFAIKPDSHYNVTLAVKQTNEQDTIKSIGLTAPVGMQRTSLSSSTLNGDSIAQMTATWTPTPAQYGQHVFCFRATDSSGKASTSRCVTLLAGASPPEEVGGTLQPNASNLQTVPHHYATFSIDFDQQIFKPTSLASIRVWEVNGSRAVEVHSIVAATSGDVTLRQHPDNLHHYQLRFAVSKKLRIDGLYAITMDHGVVVGVQSCTGGGVPFEGISDTMRWQFVADHTTGNASSCGQDSMQFLPYGAGAGDQQLDLGNGTACTTGNLAPSANGLPVWSASHARLTICENGVVMLDQQRPIRHPQVFPGNWTTQPTILAPYWCLADNSHSKTLPEGIRSHVWYHFYERQVAADVTILEEIESLVIAKERAKDKSFYFTATWAVMVTWERITPYPSLYKYQLHNSFQAVVATDGLRSFAVFAYDSESIQWSAPVVYDVDARFGHAVVGYSTPSAFYNDRRSGTAAISSIDSEQQGTSATFFEQACVSGALFVSKLYSQAALDGPRAKCLSWHSSQPNPVTWMKHFHPCPCTLAQANADSRFQVIESLSPRTCFQNAVPSLTGSSQECCYRTQQPGYGAFIEGPPDGGSSLRFSWLSYDPATVRAEETLPYQWCCRDEALCYLFWEKRPSQPCTGYSPPGLGVVAPPLLKTFRGSQVLLDSGRSFLLSDTNGTFRSEVVLILDDADQSPVLASLGVKGTGSDTVVVEVSPEGSLSFAVNGAPLTDKVLQVFSDEGENVTIECLQWQRNCHRVANASSGPSSGDMPPGISVRRGVSIVVRNGTHGSVIMDTGIAVDVSVLPASNSIVAIVSFPGALLANSTGLVSGQGLASQLPIASILDLPEYVDKWRLPCANLTLVMDPGCLPASSPLPATGTPVATPATPASSYSGSGGEPLNFANQLCAGDGLCLVLANATQDLNKTAAILELLATEGRRTVDLETESPQVATTSPRFVLEEPPVVKMDLSNITDLSKYAIVLIPVAVPSAISVTGGTEAGTFWATISRNTPAADLQFVVLSNASGTSILIRPVIFVCDCSNGGLCSNSTFSSLSSERTRIRSCDCSEAYDGLYCELDRDGCQSSFQPCSGAVACIDQPAPAVGFLCGSCPSGFSGDGQSCYDINECQNTTQPCQQQCINTQSSYVCGCNLGFRQTSANSTACKDIDECALHMHSCGQVCQNTAGSYACTCASGHVLGANNACAPLNPCASGNGCEQLCSYNATSSSATCSCLAGYTTDANKCLDIDECSQSPALCSHGCANLNGSFRCSCPVGYQLSADLQTCEDYDECSVATACPGDQLCVNRIGSYSCQCRTGYKYNSTTASCQAVSCGEPERAPMASFRGGMWTFGGQIVYGCDAGYVLAGSQTARCTASGNWSSPPPSCYAITCPLLTLAANSRASESDRNVSSVWRVRCSEGFSIRGAATLQCLANGQWSASPPICEIVHCPALQVPNASASSPDTAYGSVVNVACADGFREAGGNATLRCTATGRWSGVALQCADCACNALGAAGSRCDKATGQCACRTLVSGVLCDRCSPDAHGMTALGCTACNCSRRSTVCTTADDGVDGVAPGQSNCTCPPEYSGLRCEACAVGYTLNRTGRLQGDACVPCDCGGHSSLCDAATGACLACGNRTAGARCERCSDGSFGDASQPAGCSPCRCNGSTSAGDGGCDSLTGACTCRANFAGPSCDRCAPQHSGFPSCSECGCNANGSESRSCNATTGQCPCRDNVQGRRCDRCSALHYGLEAGACTACQCDPAGSSGPSCDQNSGDCPCYRSVAGRRCDECSAHRFDFPTCSECGCHPNGTKPGSVCNATTGQCRCTANAAGAKCDRCSAGFFDFPRCLPCDCDERGVAASVGRSTCDAQTGRCPCEAMYAGARCDRCAPGYYRLNESLPCGQCDCSALGVVPDVVCGSGDGQCRCRPNVVGSRCDRCAVAYYGFASGECSGCACDATGSTSLSCDAASGACPCVTNVEGRRCDACRDGHFGFPKCSPCGCHPQGTLGGSVCDKTTGECRCAADVVGATCSECADGRFDFPRCAPCDCDASGATAQGGACDKATGKCSCRSSHAGARCEQCAAGHYRLDGNATCTPCECDQNGVVSRGGHGGTDCADASGNCSCRPAYTGARCNECAPGFYRHNATQCEPCDCDPSGAVTDGSGDDGACKNTTGECECQPGHAGSRCERCDAGHFRLNETAPCRPCDCNEQGTVPGSDCSASSGQCQCRTNVAGRTCGRCDDGHYGFGADECRRCPCHARGTVSCVDLGPRFQCYCWAGARGELCDTCRPGYYSSSSPLDPCNNSTGRLCHDCCCLLINTVDNLNLCDEGGRCFCKQGATGDKCDRCLENYFLHPQKGCEPIVIEQQTTAVETPYYVPLAIALSLLLLLAILILFLRERNRRRKRGMSVSPELYGTSDDASVDITGWGEQDNGQRTPATSSRRPTALFQTLNDRPLAGANEAPNSSAPTVQPSLLIGDGPGDIDVGSSRQPEVSTSSAHPVRAASADSSGQPHLAGGGPRKLGGTVQAWSSSTVVRSTNSLTKAQPTASSNVGDRGRQSHDLPSGNAVTVACDRSLLDGAGDVDSLGHRQDVHRIKEAAAGESLTRPSAIQSSGDETDFGQGVHNSNGNNSNRVQVRVLPLAPVGEGITADVGQPQSRLDHRDATASAATAPARATASEEQHTLESLHYTDDTTRLISPLPGEIAQGTDKQLAPGEFAMEASATSAVAALADIPRRKKNSLPPINPDRMSKKRRRKKVSQEQTSELDTLL